MPYNHAIPDIALFDQNALFFANTGDGIVVRRAAPDPSFLEYLRALDVIPGSINFLISHQPLSLLSVFEDSDLIQRVRGYISAKDAVWQLDSFMYTHHEHAFAKRLGIQINADPNQYDFFSGKNFFRSSARKAQVPIPEGTEYRNTSFSVGLAAAKLFLRSAQEVIIKHDEGGAGLNSRRVRRGEFVNALLRLSPERIMPLLRMQTSSDTYVVEKWYADVVCSPSIQYLITDDGFIQTLSVHVQTFQNNGVTYRGCKSFHWLSKDVVLQLKDITDRHVSSLRSGGYRGHVTYNAIERTGGDILITEINPRRVMSSYPFQIMQRLGFDPDQMPPYITQEVENPHWRRLSHAALLERCGRSLFSKGRGSGIIPYDVKFRASRGSVMFLSVGRTKNEAEYLMRNVYTI